MWCLHLKARSVCLRLWLIVPVVNESRTMSRVACRHLSAARHLIIASEDEFQQAGPPRLAGSLAGPPTRQIPTQAGADVGSKIWGCSSSCHKTGRKYRRTEKCRGRPAISAGPVFAICRYWRPTSKATLYSAHTWRDRAPLIQRTVLPDLARSVIPERCRTAGATVRRVYFWHWSLDRMRYGTVT